MTIKLGLSIYNKPWLIEPNAALHLLDMWDRMIESKIDWHPRSEEDKDAYQQYKKLFAVNKDVVFAPVDTYEARNFTGFEGAKTAIIPVQGPLMKSDFCGEFGTASLLNQFLLAENTSSIQSILLLIDSPGGTVDGTFAFADAIKRSKKATLAVVDGMAASAAYWIGSSANEMVATSRTDVIGSIGTMMSWRDYSKMQKEAGIVLREYTATQSTDKNRAFNEANDGYGQLLIQELLDPINNEFLQAVKVNRGGKIDLEKENVLTGKVYVGPLAKQVGLIDNIISFNKAVQRGLQMAQQKTQIKMDANSPFQRTLLAAGAESFTLVDDIGFGLTEANLNGIEAALTQASTREAALEQQLSESQAASTTATEQLATANETIGSLRAEVAQLKRGPASSFSQTTKSEGDKLVNETPETVPSYLDPNNPANQFVDQYFGTPSSPKK